MSPCLLLPLVCCLVAAESHELTLRQLDSLHASIEATPTELYVGDVVFVRIGVTNKGDAPVLIPAVPFPAWNLYLNDSTRHTRFALQRDIGGFGMVGPQKLLPGERLGYLGGSRLLVRMPSLRCVGFPFWNPETLSKDGYGLSFTVCVGRSGQIGAGGPTLVIRPRPKAEMAKLLELCGPRPYTRRDFPADWDPSRPSLAQFGLPFAPPQASTAENLKTLEVILSPGTLRDCVRFTRRAQAVYDEKDIQRRRKATTDLLQWLDKRPEIQRHIMAENLLTWASQNKGLGKYLFEFIDQVIPRLPKESQEKCRNSNNDSRRRYLEHLRKQERQPGHAGKGE